MTATAAATLPGLAGFVEYLETGTAAPDLFAPDLFADLSFPQWRLQAESAAATLAIRSRRHPWPGRVRVQHTDATASGFAVSLEERWEADGQQWYCREQVIAEVRDGRIVRLWLSCTGDWDENTQRRHAEAVRLTRP
jgi:hypothetical protein